MKRIVRFFVSYARRNKRRADEFLERLEEQLQGIKIAAIDNVEQREIAAAQDAYVREVQKVTDTVANEEVKAELIAAHKSVEEIRAHIGADTLAYLSIDGRMTLVDVIVSDTTSLTTTMELVEELRVLAGSGEIRQLREARVLVGGYVAGALDFQTLLLKRFPLIVALILLLIGVFALISLFQRRVMPLYSLVASLGWA
jgi:hypothetical protein